MLIRHQEHSITKIVSASIVIYVIFKDKIFSGSLLLILTFVVILFKPLPKHEIMPLSNNTQNSIINNIQSGFMIADKKSFKLWAMNYIEIINKTDELTQNKKNHIIKDLNLAISASTVMQRDQIFQLILNEI